MPRHFLLLRQWQQQLPARLCMMSYKSESEIQDTNPCKIMRLLMTSFLIKLIKHRNQPLILRHACTKANMALNLPMTRHHESYRKIQEAVM